MQRLPARKFKTGEEVRIIKEASYGHNLKVGSTQYIHARTFDPECHWNTGMIGAHESVRYVVTEHPNPDAETPHHSMLVPEDCIEPTFEPVTDQEMAQTMQSLGVQEN